MNKKCLAQFIIIFTIFLFFAQNIKADADLDKALLNAPLGVKISGIFTPGTQSGNSAKVMSVTNPSIKGTDAILITPADTQKLGSIWSTDSNYFDLSKNQVASMWMYFGNRGSNAGDGMALVLQNDSRGLKANGYKGQALNVYGNDQANYSSSSQIASTGIQNSWALEFDTFLNQDDGRDNAGIASSFDLGNKSNGDNKIIKNGHMASTYPGESSSYVRYSSESSILGDKYWYGLNQYGLINGVINSDANWHHVTLSWNKDTQKMTYTINDKKLDGTPLYQAQPGYAYQTKTIDLDVKKLGTAATSTGHIRYGFTGSTGGYYANNVVIFD
ncbi:lectin-like domain-containing protein [Lactobacillus terrae]|uniref:lectin-like domain-containing protein n=1 Tax=Lactobacillus terrae TaxID=2269374 RepID=UPI000C1B64EE|nr:hypothetical protein [Lactobacillus terrae]